MKKTLFSVLLVVVFFNAVFAQSKINFALASKLHDNKKSSLGTIDALIKGDVKSIESLVNSVGGEFKYSSGDIAAVRISIPQIAAILSNKAIQRIEAFPPQLHLLNDSMLLNNNIIAVHNGQAPLTQGYDGKGVVVGIIDSGIDITHPDFKDSLEKTRINYLWDQTKPAINSPLAPINYGQEWNNLQIDSGLAVGHTDADQHGHGTHVAGIAVGNGRATGKYKGVAPNADIIVVAVDFDGSAPFKPAYPVADAAYYIYKKATEMGKPCVINASLGSSLGSHDGQDLQSQFIDNLIKTQPGRAFVAAAGNSGNSQCHLGYTVTSDTNFTMFKYNAGKGSVYIQMFADTNDFKNVHFAIGADQMSPLHSLKGTTPFATIANHIGVLDTVVLYNNGKRLGIIERYGDISGGVYSMEFYITPDSITYNWRLITTGSGKFDVWSFDLVGFPLPSLSTMKDSAYYKLPDLNKTIESGFQCLDNVITVANYTNRQSYKEYDGSGYLNTSNIPGKRVSSSGVGPTRDGRMKPDIASPGDVTIAAVESAWKAGLISTNNTSSMAFGGYHVRSGGTSHSSPSVAGIAALYLQKYPTATALQVKQAITACAKQDVYTGNNLPNNYWGYGKVDALATLTHCVSSVPENSTALQHKLLIFPNPSYSGSVINIDVITIQNFDKIQIKIYNALGELVKTITVNSSSIQFNNSLVPGTYFCHLQINGSAITTEKLVIL